MTFKRKSAKNIKFMFWIILNCVLSYLLGSIPFSYLIAKAYGKNLYQVGSGNIGAANVWRATKKAKAFWLAVIGDSGKGIVAILLAKYFSQFDLRYDPWIFLASSSFFVVMGHNWPIFLKFKGGRGLASLLGILIYLNLKLVFLSLLLTGASIFLTQILTKKKIELKGNLKEKVKELFSIFTSQVLGRDIGLSLSAIAILFLDPETFKILIFAAILSAIKHIKRTKSFLEGNEV